MGDLTVTVYSTPGCQQCRMTYVLLEQLGIRYKVVDLAENEEARTWVTEDLGYSAAPIVVVDQDPQNHWWGFRDDRLRALTAHALPAMTG
jgi:glutaredoxin-like protein NrdH